MIKLNPRITVLCLILFWPNSLCAEVFQWKDEQGRIHFSDKPSEAHHSEKVIIEVNSVDTVTVEPIPLYVPPKKPSKRKRVVMYMTEWCGYCKKAADYFKRNNIPFKELDIAKDKKARKRFDKLGGKGVPLILVGKQRMSGFSAQRFEAIYKQ